MSRLIHHYMRYHIAHDHHTNYSTYELLKMRWNWVTMCSAQVELGLILWKSTQNSLSNDARVRRMVSGEIPYALEQFP